MKKRSLLLSQHGFSLIDMTVAAALSLLLALGGAVVLIDLKKVDVDLHLQQELDQTHQINLLETKSLLRVSKWIDLTREDGTQNSTLAECFSRQSRRTDCQPFAKNNLVVKNERIGLSIQSVTLISVECSSQKCGDINIHSITRVLDENRSFAIRKSSTSFPGSYFAFTPKLSYDCSLVEGSILAGINFSTNEPICRTGPQMMCAQSAPFSEWGLQPDNGCMAMENNNCEFGVEETKAFLGQSRCQELQNASLFPLNPNWLSAGGP